MAQIITMQCEECKERNYTTTKTKTMVQQRIKLNVKKYCSRCKKHTSHKEVK